MGLDGRHRSPEFVDHSQVVARALFDLVGERLDEVRASEWVNGVGDTRLVADDLLGAQRELGRTFGRQSERLVESVRVQTLRAPERGGERLQSDAHDVVLGLLRGQRRAPVWV